MFWYHELTNHSYRSIRSESHTLEWEKQPVPFKIYPYPLKTVKLTQKHPLHRFIYRIGGISAKKVYPGVTYYLRTVPSAGALYPTEIYFQSRGVEDLEDGIWHFDIQNGALRLLHAIGETEGIEAEFEDNRKIEGFLFLFSTVYFRSAWKYRTRAFRYCLLDTGHMLGALEASSFLYDHALYIRYRFDKESLNRSFGLGEREFFLSCAQVGRPREERIVDFKMRLEDINPPYERDPVIEKAYYDSLHPVDCTAQYGYDPFTYRKESFEETIMKRRSVREFGMEPISKVSFEAILENASRKIVNDCDEKVSLYYIVHRVEGMEPGLYLEGVLLKAGDFRAKSAYLCLEQPPGGEGAVTFFLTTASQNYQPASMKAGIIGHRIYLAGGYLHINCSGIGAYYDDEIRTFLETEDMVLYALAIGA
ncbi:MAG: dehydrogenase [Campylobacteraceae bacterium 4484_4]|nr:MAG: dehydrogenase [Campylobacteraceae bacterium 4484_4]